MQNHLHLSQLTNQEEKLIYIQNLVNENQEKNVCALFKAFSDHEIANILESFPQDERLRLWQCVPNQVKGEVLAEIHEESRQPILEAMGAQDIIALTEQLDAHNAAEILDSLEDEVEANIIEQMDALRRQAVQGVLAYAEDTVGRYMHTDTVSIRDNIRLGVVQRFLRRQNSLHKDTLELMVVNEKNHLVGTLHLVDILKNEPDSLVKQYMSEPFSVEANTNAIEAAKLIRHKNKHFAPVIDDCMRLVGQLTADEVFDLTLEESEQTVMNMAGLDEEEDLFAPIKKSINGRTIWLGINLATAFLAAAVIGQFEAVIAQVVALAVLMPVVASMGGIAGSQTLTLTIRGLALGKIGGSNRVILFNKEVGIGIINGFIWAIIVALIAQLWFQEIMISVVIGLAILINMVAASVAGVLVPLVLKKIGQDPALSGAVILTTVTDVVGFLSFLGLATVLILT